MDVQFAGDVARASVDIDAPSVALASVAPASDDGPSAAASGEFSSGRAAGDVSPSSFDSMLFDAPSSAAGRGIGDVAPASVAPASDDAPSAAASGGFSSGRASGDVPPSSFFPTFVDPPSSTAWRAAGDVAPASVAPASVDARSAAASGGFSSGRASGDVPP